MSVPTTYEEAILALEELMSEEDLYFLDTCRDLECVSVLQPSVGRLLRTQWDLWNPESPLANDLKKLHGQLHPEGMSRFILEAFYKSRLPTRFDRLMAPESRCPISRPYTP